MLLFPGAKSDPIYIHKKDEYKVKDLTTPKKMGSLEPVFRTREFFKQCNNMLMNQTLVTCPTFLILQ